MRNRFDLGLLMKRITEWLTRISTSNSIPLATRIGGLLFFLFLLAAFLFGTIKIASYEFTSKTAMIIVWSLWWPFIYLTLFFIARMWCGFICPLSLVNQWGNRLHKGRTINYRRWAFLPFVLFFIVVYLEQTSGLFLSVPVTIVFFSLFFVIAFVMGVLFTRYSFCKIICPIGTLLGVFSRLSIIGVRTKKDICATCTEKSCLLGGKAQPCPMFNNVPAIASNKDCLMCMNCVKNCPHDSAHIAVVAPGKEILEKRNFTLSESYFIIALFGFAAVLTANGTILTRKILEAFHISLNGAVLRGADFLIAIGLFIVVFTLFGYVCAKIISVKPKKFLSEAGYIYLPTIFFILFFTIAFGFLQPWLALGERMITAFKLFFLGIGVVWSAYLIIKMAVPAVTPDKKKLTKKMVMAIQFFLLVLIALLWAGVFIGTLLDAGTTENALLVKEGDIVKIDAYSMGFDPTVLVVKKGTKVVIDVTNKDIVHSFDIDEFNVHQVIKGGETTRITFTPNKTGEFQFYCIIPGHTEAGMKGILRVVEE